MRDDMKKVLTERPRYGHSRKYRDVRRAENRGDIEDLPHCRSMRAPYDSYTESRKEFSDLLGPLKRFMKKSVGRRYDDVWSEICQAVPSGNTVDAHLKGHAKDLIETNTFIKNGEVYCRPEFRFGEYKPEGLYVDPRDGIIYDGTPKAVSKKKKNKLRYNTNIGTFMQDESGIYHPQISYYRRGNHNDIDFCLAFFEEEKEAIKINGIWYWILFGTVPPPKPQVYIENDEIKTRIVDSWALDIVYRDKKKSGERYRSGKIQMNSRDLRQHGLMND